MEADFGGYATRANVKCTDGRTIKPQAFQHMDGVEVPLVWQHGHNSPENILGHALLEAREDGVYAYGFFNQTKAGQIAKQLVHSRNIKALSIYANQLKELAKSVLHGTICEVSLVLKGANKGAFIDNINIRHSEFDVEEMDDQVIIHFVDDDYDLEFGELEDESVEHAEEKTLQEVFDSLDEEQKTLVHFMIGAALEGPGDEDDAEHSDDDENVLIHEGKTLQDVYNTLDQEQKDLVSYMIGVALETADEDGDADLSQSGVDENNDEGDLSHQEEGKNNMNTATIRNAFDQAGIKPEDAKGISHADVKAIFADGKKRGSFREAVQEYVLAHGITDIEVLFPEAQTIANTPEFDKRRTEWVAAVLADTHKTPFAKIKTISADLTQDEARAKGYIKGNFKLEEWIGVTKRTTSPTTVYKKQKLDRDDILDITDFDVVSWLMVEMRIMLEEEVARAILIGDGRDISSEDKIKDPLAASDGTGIRSIINDHELYVTTLYANVADSNSNYEEVIDVVMDGFEYYKGTGSPTFYTTIKQLNKFKKAKDANGQRYYKNNSEVAEALGVSKIVTVEPMNEVAGLIGIIVNLQDYNIGTNKGGEITNFDFFDIDYNQYKYLMETRLSGALTKIKSALVIRETAAENVLATPSKPTFVQATGVVTIPTVTGVVYKDGEGDTIAAGAMAALDAGESVTIYSVPASGYYFQDTASDSWTFKRPAA